jgi:hypothetical protein
VILLLHESNNSCECDGFHRFTTTDSHCRFAVNICFACRLPDPYSCQSLSGFLVGNGLAASVFSTSEVHHTHIVTLLPPAGRFLSNVTINVADDVTSSKQAACEALAGFPAVSDEFRFRVLAIRSEDVPITFDYRVVIEARQSQIAGKAHAQMLNDGRVVPPQSLRLAFPNTPAFRTSPGPLCAAVRR